MAQSTPAPASAPVSPVRYLSERKVAELTGLTCSKLQQDRHYRRGIPYIRLDGRTIRYSDRDVHQYMEERRVVPAGQ